jgi:hypothetical protein
LNFITGTSGVIYPPSFLQYLNPQGRAFENCCQRNDDVWLTLNALRGGFPIAQVKDLSVHFPWILGSQNQALYKTNVQAGGNQYALTQSFSNSDLAALRTHLLSEGGTPEGGIVA